MNDNKNSFILYHDQREIFKKLPKEQAGELIQAIFDYEVTGEMPKLPELLSYVIIPIKQSIDRNRLKYDDIKEKRIKAGQKGGKQTQANQANACFDNKNQANQASSSVSVPVSVPVPVNVNVTLKEIKESFDIFYKAYPKHISRGQAEKTFTKVLKKQKIKTIDELNAFSELLIDAIKLQLIEHENKNPGADYKYWQNPSTWLNAGGWLNEVDLSIPNQQQEQQQQTPKTAGQRNVEFMDWLRQKNQEQTNQQQIGENKNADKKINGY